MKKILLIYLYILFSSSICNAKDDSLNYSLMPYLEYMIIHHEPQFDKIPEIQYCCQSRSIINDGKGWGLGLKYELSLPFNSFIGLKIGYNNFTANMASPESLLMRQDDQVSNIYIRHYTNSTFDVVFINPYLKLKLIDNISIFLGGFAAPFLTKKYEIYEKIESPLDYVYDDTKSNIRNQQSKDFETEKGLWSGFNFGVGYDLYLFKNIFYVSPEISYNLGMNNIIKNLDWEVNSLNIAINLGLNFHKPKDLKEIRTVVTKIDTVYYNQDFYKQEFKIGKMKIDSTKYIRDDVTEIVIVHSRIDTIFRGKKYELNLNMDNQDLYVEIRKANQEFQNLDVVFFKNERDELLKNYQMLKNKNEFKFDSIDPDPIKIHYNILNIIGYRLNNSANSKITLVGESDSLNPKKLIEKRFNKIKEYLSNIWGVDSNRILTSIETSLNQNSKNKYDLRFIEENNKIKIIPNTNEIFEPIKKINFDEIKTFYPNEIKIDVSAAGNIEILKYNLLLYQNLNSIYQINDSIKQNTFNIYLNDSIMNSINLSKPIDVTYIAESSENKKLITSDSISINRKMLNEKVSRLALIFFEFDSDKIINTSLAQINELTKYITNKSIISIKGYTDNIGTPEYNKQLSINRAQNTAQLILQYQPKANIKSIEGFGSEVHTNGIKSFDSPVERFLSRTVVIEVFDELY